MSDVRCDEVNVVDYRVKSLLRFPASNIRDNRQSFPRRGLYSTCVYVYAHAYAHLMRVFILVTER